MALPVVTPENYYSPEMNMAYMGSTQFKAFERCEAAALAELKGEYRPPSSAALLVGGYIDAWFSGELPLYQAQHPEIFKRDGTLKAEYVKATEVVARLQADDLYSLLMSGKSRSSVPVRLPAFPLRSRLTVCWMRIPVQRSSQNFRMRPLRWACVTAPLSTRRLWPAWNPCGRPKIIARFPS